MRPVYLRDLEQVPVQVQRMRIVRSIPERQPVARGLFQYEFPVEYLAELPPRIKAGRRETRVVGTADLPNFFRRPFGQGWALVGDAGYHKGPLTARGITDAFQQAQMLAESLDAVFSGRKKAERALSDYEERRNAHSQALYEFTVQRASPQLRFNRTFRLYLMIISRSRVRKQWYSS
jgi:flavin-dependent dehydrogenase